MQRMTLERHQVWLYLGAILAGLLLGSAWPAAAQPLDALLWIVLALLLYATFVQVPLIHVREAFADRRFLTAVLVGNFVVVPVIVWGLLQILPDDPAIRLGVALVLLVPCTDWFITFTQLGGGDTARAIAVSPVNLLLQLALLPVYLWLMLGPSTRAGIGIGEVWPALLIVAVPLLAAALTERWLEARPSRLGLREQLAWLPVPLLALVVFLIAATQVETVADSLGVLPVVVPVFIAFVLLAAPLARLLAGVMDLPREQGRTLAFSIGTRNSFVVLPVALALPGGLEAAAVVVVVQSLVELFGMAFYLWWVPKVVFR